MARTPGSGFVTEAMLETALEDLSGNGTGGTLIPLTSNVTIPAGGDVGQLVGYRNFGGTTRTVDGEALAAGEHAIFVWTGTAWERIDAGADPYLVTAPAPTFTDMAGTANDRYVIPSATGVTYEVNGVAATAGTKTPTAGQAVTVTAKAVSPYTLKGVASWSHTFSTATEPIPTGPVSVTHLHSAQSSSTAASQSFAAVPIGAAETHRLIVCAFISLRSASRTINSCTIGGVAATVVNTADGGYSINFAYAVVPSGTTADVDATFSGGLDQGGAVLDVFEVENTVKTHSATKTQSGGSPATIPASPSGGVALLHAYRTGSTATYTATGATELVDYQQTLASPGQVGSFWTTATGSPIDVSISGSPSPSTAGLTFDKAV